MSGPFGSSQWMYNPSSSFYPYAIDQSLRFEDGDSAHLSRTPSSTGNRKTWTWSAWIKRSNISNDNQTMWRSFGASGATGDYIILNADNTIYLGSYNFSGSPKHVWRLITSAVFRDVSSWYHIVASVDTTQSTSSNRAKLYINGQQVTEFGTETYPSLNYDTYTNFASPHYLGIRPDVTDNFDGYMADVNLIDGTALGPDSFGEFKDSIWVPKNVSGLTFGTNGFHLTFEATGTATTAQDTTAQTNIGDDQSGLGNNFAVSGLVASDVTEDTPTNNHSTWNPLVSKLNITLSEGNTVVNLDDNASGEADMVSTMVCPLGVDIYGEFKATAFHGGAADSGINIGIIEQGFDRTEQTNTIRQISGGVFYAGNGYLYTDSVASGSAQATYTTNDIIGIKINRTTDEVKFYKNNALQWTEDIDATKQYHFGVDSGYTNSTRAISYQAYFAASSWTHTPEDNFLALCSASLPEPNIVDGSEYFNTVLWTGDSGTQSITGVGFQPDWVWGKNRENTYNNVMYDSVRGVEKRLEITPTSTETTKTNGLTAFGTDGFSVGGDGALNENAKGIVAWNWLAGGSAVSNTDGTITSSISANPEAGFSIVSWSGTSSAGTVGHGLSKVPSMYIVKNRTGAYFWAVYHSGLTNSATSYIDLDNSVKEQTGQTHWNSTAPTNEVFSVNNQLSVNNSSHTYIAYCFADIEGFSKAGVYSGNGNANGTYVHTGFRPAWIMVKRSDSSTGSYWWIHDNKRNTTANGNDTDATLHANAATAESGLIDCETDFLSNGFKIRNTANQANNSSGTYIYLAFAEQPFKYSNAR